MNLALLREDVKRAKERLMKQKSEDRDNEVALAMYGADLKRALEALERQVDKGQPVRWPLMAGN